MHAALTELPYRKLPGLRQFLLDVRARTADGETIVLVGASPAAEEYFYGRALYVLAGRRVVPPSHLGAATVIAAYRSSPRPPGFAVVWRGRDGELLRRMR